MNEKNDKVFVSSTVYDLIDIRAELEETLRMLGLNPILSDSITSDFSVLPDRNSIETCLSNVRSSAYMIVVLSKRYGPSLKNVGYEDISATHLEYRAAKEQGLPVYIYVRDRLEGDYSVWRKNRNLVDIKLPWVEKENDYGLFVLLEEHKTLKEQSNKSNWYQTFTDSVDLKQLIKRDFRRLSFPHEIQRVIETNRVPIITCKITVASASSHLDDIRFNLHLHNSGTVPAYNMSSGVLGESERLNLIVLPPGESCDFHFTASKQHLLRLKITRQVEAKYQTVEGYWIIDKFEFNLKGVSAREITKDVRLIEREYAMGDGVELKIRKDGSS